MNMNYSLVNSHATVFIIAAEMLQINSRHVRFALAVLRHVHFVKSQLKPEIALFQIQKDTYKESVYAEANNVFKT